MRLKAKAFIAQKAKQKDEEKTVQLRKKMIDPNNFTCKFCNGTIE